MRESKAYISFLKNNLFLILAPGLLIGLISFYAESWKPVIYSQNILFEVAQKDFDPSNLIVIYDNAVGLVRAANVQKTLVADQSIEAGAVRIAPGLIRLDVSGTGREILLPSLENIREYVKEYYKDKGILIEQRGEIINGVKSPNVYLGFATGFLFGICIGLIFSLIRVYLRLY